MKRRVPFVLKPASRTPVGALIMGEVLASAPHLPEGAFSILPCSREGADLFTTDERFKLLTFTGSPTVGSMLAQLYEWTHKTLNHTMKLRRFNNLRCPDAVVMQEPRV